MASKKRWDEDDVQSAICLVEKGMSIRQAAVRNYVPVSTLSRRIRKGSPQKRGNRLLMAKEDEIELVKYIIYMARASEPVSVLWVKETATRMLKLR